MGEEYQSSMASISTISSSNHSDDDKTSSSSKIESLNSNACIFQRESIPNYIPTPPPVNQFTLQKSISLNSNNPIMHPFQMEKQEYIPEQESKICKFRLISHSKKIQKDKFQQNQGFILQSKQEYEYRPIDIIVRTSPGKDFHNPNKKQPMPQFLNLQNMQMMQDMSFGNQFFQQQNTGFQQMPQNLIKQPLISVSQKFFNSEQLNFQPQINQFSHQKIIVQQFNNNSKNNESMYLEEQMQKQEDKKIRRHERNLYPYFGVHFMKCLRRNSQFQEILINQSKIDNPIGYLIEHIGKQKLNTKQNLEQLLLQKDSNINFAIKLWFEVFLKKSLNRTRDSKNKHISDTHSQRKRAFLRRGQQIVENISQLEYVQKSQKQQ